MERKQLLEKLLKYEGSLEAVVMQLKKFSWDSAEELVVLQNSDVISVLERFLNSQLSAAQVENWANAIEGREDIAFAPESHDLLLETINELANPLLSKMLDGSFAKEIISRLS